VFGAGGLGHEAGGLRPPLTSPAPTSLVCPHQPRLPPCRAGGLASALMLGFGLRLWQSAWSFSFSFALNRKQTQTLSGLRREPTLKVWQTFRLFAGFRCIFPFAQIHFHAFLQMRLQQYTQGYPVRCTQGSAASKEVRSSGLQAKLKFWSISEAQALASGAALASRLASRLACGLNDCLIST